jgi:hypothetical protein
VLTWSDCGLAVLWDIGDPLAVLNLNERILELVVRSGTAIDRQQNLRLLSFREWQDKAKSPEFRTIDAKLKDAKTGSIPHSTPLAPPGTPGNRQ